MNSFIILWAIITIACMVLYHKTFRVVYFGNVAKAMLSEFVVSAFVAGVLVTLAATFWWVIDIVLVIALLLFLGNQKTTQAIVCVVLIVLISIVGIKGTFGKDDDESAKQNDSVVVNDSDNVIEEEPEEYNESDYYSDNTDEWLTKEQILGSYHEKYGKVSYAMYDIDASGSEVLLVHYGETDADKVIEVYLPNVSTGEYIYSGCFDGDGILYEAEGDVGIYAVKGQQGVEWLYHITIEEGTVYQELLSEKLLDANETYYKNDNPILFTEY